MRPIRYILSQVISVFLLCAGLFLYFTTTDKPELNGDGTLYLLPFYSKAYYSMLTDNTGYTNINGISNVYVNHLNSGYVIEKEDRTDSYIDVIFTKEDELPCRYYFKYPECYIAFFYGDYELSYELISYIIEEK